MTTVGKTKAARTFRSRFGSLAIALGVLLLAAAGLAAVLGKSDGASPVLRKASSGAAGSPGDFAFLAAQSTNRCNLGAGELRRMPDSKRLQGSCCFPMDQARYNDQVKALGQYRAIPQVPRDPYDIPVSLAKRLLRFRSITLTKAQTAEYRQAMSMTDEKGPCCCRCWRWQAFSGLSKHLIARRRWSAPRLARLIEALDGCGGPKATESRN